MGGIADTYGFDWETLWGHENNQSLQDSRNDPNVLMAGDRVFVPDKRKREESCEPTHTHVFQLKGIPCRLNLRLLDNAGNPRVGLKYKLAVDGKLLEGTTPDDGLISQIVPPNADKADLTVIASDGTEEKYPLDLAHLNPIHYASGVQARLKNLGYYKGEFADYDDDTADAIRRFQEDNGLPITGQPDDATKDALMQAHGC